MPHHTVVFIRCIFTVAFLGTLVAGVHLLRNHERLFGVDSRVPSETGSARAYSTLQVFIVWAHAVLLTGSFALLLH